MEKYSTEESLRETLKELDIIHKTLDEFEETKLKKKFVFVTQKVKDLSQKLEQLWNNPDCKSKENSALLIQLSSGMRDAFTRIRKLSTIQCIEDEEDSVKEGGEVTEISTPIFLKTKEKLGVETVRPTTSKLKGFLQLFHHVKRGWYRRWFQQYGDKLYYFVNEESEKPISHIAISEVSTICTNAQKWGFDLITAAQTYHLRTTSDSELQYWLSGLNQWKRQQENNSPNDLSLCVELSEEEEDSEEGFLEEEKNEKFGSVSSVPLFDHSYNNSNNNNNNNASNFEVSRQFDRSNSLNSIKTKSEFEERIKHLENQLTERTLTMVSLDRTVKELKEKILNLENENITLKEDAERNLKIIDDFKKRSQSLETEVEIRKNSKDSHYIDHLISQLRSLESNLREKEEIIDNLTRNQKPLMEKIRKDEPIIRNLTENLSQTQLELQAKQKLITKLASELKELRLHTDPHKNLSPSRGRDEYSKLRDSIEAHQIQNRFLSSELFRIQVEKDQTIQLKEDNIQRLTKELETLNKEFQSLRQQHLLLKGADNSYLQEFEDVKKELFYALGVGIKLHMAERGEHCNIDIHTLYDEAQHINYKKWNEWITNRMKSAM